MLPGSSFRVIKMPPPVHPAGALHSSAQRDASAMEMDFQDSQQFITGRTDRSSSDVSELAQNRDQSQMTAVDISLSQTPPATVDTTASTEADAGTHMMCSTSDERSTPLSSNERQRTSAGRHVSLTQEGAHSNTGSVEQPTQQVAGRPDGAALASHTPHNVAVRRRASAILELGQAQVDGDVWIPPSEVIETATSRRSSEELSRQLGAARARNMCAALESFSSEGVQLSAGQLIRKPGFTPKTISWQDDIPRCYKDSSGISLLVHLPSLLLGQSLNHATDALIAFAKLHPTSLSCGAGADARGRDSQDAYRTTQGHLAGQLKLVKAWHQIGHHTEAPSASGHIFDSAKRYRDACNLMRDLRLISDPVEAVLRAVDPAQYVAMQDLRLRLEGACAYLRGLNAIDPIPFMGRIVVFNRQTPAHNDKRDPANAWTCIVAAGDFRGGSLRISNLNLTVRLEPGDAVMLRGHVLMHEVEDWEGSQRISIVHFTHQSLWDFASLNCP
ncbi:uncharacterized protein SCHCODRAFT_02663830 [Schizophyllum commune H4-8]|nr:uncharacterized protein SCHCODRAFT_02663830 [Schizophyllum commune H4-8]KAI5895948.1 hypothetical protein SCHCODRAFT_02663830 [Schizophyllum commune H4-8]